MYEIEEIKNKIICGDALEELKKFPDESIDCVICSPPYYYLRNYQVKEQIGLEPTFEDYLNNLLKIFKEIKRVLKRGGSFWLNLGDVYCSHPAGNTYISEANRGTDEVFVRKMKMNEGAKSFVNIGGFQGEQLKRNLQKRKSILIGKTKKQIGKLPDKCMMMIPERIALKMIDEQGWILRQKIIWSKQVLINKEKKTIGSAMPTSVRDRFNTTYEYLYHFVKNKKYYFDLDAARIPPLTFENRPYGIVRERKFGYNSKHLKTRKLTPEENEEKITSQIARKYGYNPEDLCPICGRKWKRHASPNSKDRKEGLRREFIPCCKKENYQGKFLNHPEAERFGSPKVRTQRRLKYVVNPDPRGDEKGGPGSYRLWKDNYSYQLIFHPNVKGLRQAPEPTEPHAFHPFGKNIPNVWLINPEKHNFQKELGSEVQEHFAVYPELLVEIPIKVSSPPDGIVLDPFIGSGTTAIVAKKLGRNYIGIDISKAYCELAQKRLELVESAENQQKSLF